MNPDPSPGSGLTWLVCGIALVGLIGPAILMAVMGK